VHFSRTGGVPLVALIGNISSIHSNTVLQKTALYSKKDKTLIKIEQLVKVALKQGVSVLGAPGKDVFHNQSHEDYLFAVNFYRGSSVRRTLLGQKMEWQGIVRNPLLHPEWSIFNKEMSKYVKDFSNQENKRAMSRTL